jgi:tetratricopeptide (TPR) repeat protein
VTTLRQRGGIAILLAACLLAAPARADDRATCERASGDAAVAACTRAIESGVFKGRELAKLYTNRGVELKRKGDIDAAIKDYDESIKLDPSDYFAYNNRANTLRDKGDLEGAIADYTTAIRLEPGYAAAYTNRARLHERMNALDKARADYGAALAAPPRKFDNSPWAQKLARERLQALAKN